VREFGIYGAIGVTAGLVITFLFLPAALTIWPPRLPQAPSQTNPERSHCLISGMVCRWRGLITIGSVVLMLAAGGGLTLLKSTVSLQYRFGPNSRIIADYRWLESHLGPLVPLEIVLDFPADASNSVLDRMLFVDQVQRELAGLADVGATVSAADFMPHVPTGRSFADIAARSYLRRRLEDNQQSLYNAHWVADDVTGHQLWRITIRAAALAQIDFGRFTAELQQQLEPLLASHPEVHATYTGMIPLIYKAQRELLNDLVESFLMAFALIAAVMIVVLGGPIAGLLAMLPNIFPIVVTFGVMGWGDVWIEIGTVMTASAALGIAVDDTFHYLTWFRRGVQSGMTHPDAVRFAFRCCARAMFQTTLVCASALLVFSLSSFMPIVRFAWLMAILLAVALVGDLVVLPAILACPLGRFFTCGRGDQRETHEIVIHLTADGAAPDVVQVA
jgi:predicted RND superfamily exporter protein